ncbi:MAG: methylmalonyl Co-A mutase-associated GTPase MeaB [Nitrospirae bacterium]|nr:MAG: methylmalonyl Co-A mutase-associated GTPase MeaB [Nitrospirota bacterium]
MCGLNRQVRETYADLIAKGVQGNQRAVARFLSLVESEDPEAVSTVHSLNRGATWAPVIGITGYPGVGKSTLVNQLIRLYRRQDKKVGVLAIDPSSSRTGGALLGDRIRMQEHATDPGVFIRSMATRGHHGGLAQRTQDVVQALPALGYDIIIIETVGVGQGEIDIVTVANVVVAVLAPGLGDDIQAMKAGLLEIAHIVVVNKKDLKGADTALRYLKEWVPCVIPTQALTGEGVEEVASAIAARVVRPQPAGTVAHSG